MNLLKHVVISLTAMAAVGFVFAWAARRRPAEIIGRKPRHLEAFSVSWPKEKVLERLKTRAGSLGYKVEEAAAETGSDVLLSDEPTAISFGFFYPIYVTAEGLGHTRVEVGAKSKAFQWGPVVTKSRRKCAEKLKTLLGG